MSVSEGSASADVFWRSKDGFEMHLQLGGDSATDVLGEAHSALTRIKKAGGAPRPHRNGAKETKTSSDSPDCPVCHQKMEYREGEGRNGKPYKGHFCPDRDCEGEPVWVND